jgi:hypothetical protein
MQLKLRSTDKEFSVLKSHRRLSRKKTVALLPEVVSQGYSHWIP